MDRAETCSEIGKQPQTKTTTSHPKLSLCIKSQDGDALYYRIRRDKRIQHVLMAYCKERNIEYKAVAFLHSDKRIRASLTPDELGMRDEEEIDAFYHQTGGAAY